jgi:hypothetical protein
MSSVDEDRISPVVNPSPRRASICATSNWLSISWRDIPSLISGLLAIDFNVMCGMVFVDESFPNIALEGQVATGQGEHLPSQLSGASMGPQDSKGIDC